MAAGSSTAPADHVLVITRIFDAPRQLVFKAWTDPRHLEQWMGPRGFRSTVMHSESRQRRLSHPYARTFRRRSLDARRLSRGCRAGTPGDGRELGRCARQSHQPPNSADTHLRGVRKERPG